MVASYRPQAKRVIFKPHSHTPVNAENRLATIGGFEFRSKHLIIIAILAISFTIAFLIRAQPVQYGFELNEFDPFFNYRATLYMVENGIPAYYEWHDTMSWHPDGRDVSGTSQAMLHLSAALTYQIFGGGMSLYDYTIIFPAVFGALTAVVIFAMVRVIGGTGAGLFAAMLYSVSLPILVRSPIGWFKSEPFGLFLSILAVYLLISGLYSARQRWVAASKLVAAGFFVSASVSAWGGNMFFIIPIGILFLALPFLRTDHKFLIWAVPLFAASTLVTSLVFERGIASTPLTGVVVAIPAAFLVVCILVQKRSAHHKLRNGLIVLVVLLVMVPVFAVANAELELVPLPSYRYINALNPFMTTDIPLVESVAEHATTSTSQSFLFHSVLMIFAGIGVWLVIRAISEGRASGVRHDMFVFSLVIGMVGVYISSSYVRLEVFAAIGVIVLASLGLSMLSREFFGRSGTIGMYGMKGDHNGSMDDEKTSDTASRPQQVGEATSPATRAARAKAVRAQRKVMRTISQPAAAHGTTPEYKRKRTDHRISIPFMVGVVALLLMPLVYSSSTMAADVFTYMDQPPTILTGGASFAIPTNDWLHALAWIKNSTAPDAIIAAWWDYGYWISTMGERTSLADNATLDSKKIERIANMFLVSPDEAWSELQAMEADYVLVFVAGQKLASNSDALLYMLQHGGDESKKQWFMRIAGHNPNIYLEPDGISGTEHFWTNTALAQFFPFELVSYVNPMDPSQPFPTYVPQSIPIYVQNVKYPADGDGPFRLAYSSPSFADMSVGPLIGIFIYEVNDDYTVPMSIDISELN